jgi:adenine-specific DNA-methyltransferase
VKKNIFKYLKSFHSTQPNDVDRLIISAFLLKNKLQVKKNEFLKSLVITMDETDEYAKLIKFIEVLNKEIPKFDTEELIELFEFVISPEDRIVNGAVYTPNNIREYIIHQTIYTKKQAAPKLKIADISCGCGGFVFNAAKELKKLTNKTYSEIFKNQIFGLDIQSYSITRTKILLCLLALSEGEDKQEFQFNLFTGDALDFNWKNALKSFTGFDIIVGNPPYVCSRHLSHETKKKLNNWVVCKSGHPDLYIPFFQIGIESLSKNGMLGFITMNSFFKSLNGRSIRKYFQEQSLEFKILDFGTEQVFKSRNTYTCICMIEKIKSNYIQYFKSADTIKLPLSFEPFNNVLYSTLDSHKGWNLQMNEIISKIESTGVSFGQIYKTRNGIATLKNNIYIFNPIDEDKEFYYLQNGSVYPIEKGICRDIINSNKLSKVGSISKIKEKVIFPYGDEIKPKLFSETFLKRNFPNAHKYLCNKREILAKRDNGDGDYEKWFAFGRTQSLERMKFKLFFPHLTDKTPNYLISTDDNLLFYNGLAIVGESKNDLTIIKKLMQSRLFWFYIENTSKPYTSGYFSLSSNYIRNFGVCNLDEEEKKYVLSEENKDVLDRFFETKYGIELHNS